MKTLNSSAKRKSFQEAYKTSIKIKTYVILTSVLLAFTVSLILVVYNTLSNQIKQDTQNNMVSHLNDLTTILQSHVNDKQESVNLALKLAHNIFVECGDIKKSDKNITISAVNQITTEANNYSINVWTLKGKQLYQNTELVDKIKDQSVETATIFQKIDDGYLRISTNVMKKDGSRAVGTFIPNSSEVIKTIETGQTYMGRAFVVNDWYLTAYEPIYIDGAIEGILYVGVKEKDYNFLKSTFQNKKYFDNGYPFLIDKEGTLIIHPTLEGVKYAEANFFKQLKVSNKKTVNRSEYKWPETGKGKQKIQYFTYFEPYECYISTSIYKSDMFAGLNYLISIISALILIGSCLLFFALSKFLSPIIKQLQTMAASAQLIAEGNLTQSIKSTRNDELGILSRALNSMIYKLKEVVNEIASGAHQLNASGVQFDSTSQDISQGATEQASSIEEVSSTMEEIATNIEYNAQHAIETEMISKKVANEIRLVNNKAQEAQKISKIISEKIKSINDIAFQTNILSLNAAIEAAKAGDHGRGFGVVAAQVQRLAEKSNLVATEIKNLVLQSVTMTNDAGNSLNELIPSIEKTSELVQNITKAGKELGVGIHQINNALQQLNVTTIQNAAGSEQLASGAKELSSQSDQLMKLISYFRTDERYIHAHKEVSATDLLTKKTKKKIKNNVTPSPTINLEIDSEVENYNSF